MKCVTFNDIEQRSDAWFAARMGKITGSNFAAACGISPYTSRAKLWRLMSGREAARDLSGNSHVQRGVDEEDNAVSAYELEVGRTMSRPGICVSLRHPWLAFSPDGMDDEVLLEVKCPNGSFYDEIPPYYMPQIQGGMMVTGLRECHFVCYLPFDSRVPFMIDHGLKVWSVKYSEEYCKNMIAELKKFYTMVVHDEEPGRTRERPELGSPHSEVIFCDDGTE